MLKFIYWVISLIPVIGKKNTINWVQVKLIVNNKLTMANRKSMIPNNQKKEPNYTFLLQQLIYFLMGGMVAILLGVGNNAFTAFFIAYLFLVFLLAFNMISDFSTLLLDNVDNLIILPRPVTESTILASRIIFIFYYLLSFTIAFACIPFFVCCIKFHLVTGVVFLFNLLFCALLSVIITHFFYLGILRFLKGEKLKDLLAYFQIFITVFMFGGYQILLRSMDYIGQLNLENNLFWFQLLPFTWMANTSQALISFHFDRMVLIHFITSLFIPYLGIVFVVRFMGKGFSEKLSSMDQGDSKITQSTRNGIKISRILAFILTQSPAEKSYFLLFWKIMGRDRKFKQRIYPMLGGILVFTVVMLMNNLKYDHKLGGNGYWYIFFLYFPVFYLISIYLNLKYSDNFKSSWIYKALPVKFPGEIINAMVKSIFFKLFIPIYFICNAVFIYSHGWIFVFELMTALLLSLIILIFILLIFKVDLPFTLDYTNQVHNVNFLIGFLILPLSAVLGGVHFLFIWLHFHFGLVVLILSGFCWFLLNQVKKIKWENVEGFTI